MSQHRPVDTLPGSSVFWYQMGQKKFGSGNCAVIMTEMIPAPKPKQSGTSWVLLIVVSPLVPIVFGFLMGVVRERLQSTWWRAAVAGCAFGILGLWSYQIWKVRG
jgi:hypothetical protein